MPLLAHGEIIANTLNAIGVVCVVLIGSGIVYFVVRDAFRFGKKEIPLSWAVVIIAVFTGLAFAVAPYAGWIVAPTLGFAYFLGRRRARKDAQSRDGETP